MSLALDAVAGGFRKAAGRGRLVLADMAARLVWLLATAGIVLTVVFAFLSSLAPPVDLPPELAGLFLAAGLAGAWPALVWGLVLAGLISFAVWSVVEAFVRSRILRWTVDVSSAGSGIFLRFLASGVLRRLAFGLATLVVALAVLGPGLTADYGEWRRAWPELRWAVSGGLLLLVMVAFVLMLLDTLLRADAIGAFGDHPGTVVIAVAAVGLFEALIRLSALAATMILMSLIPATAALALAAPVAGVGLSAAHSYLLLVRYSAIGIIRQYPIRASTQNGSSYSL